MLLLFGLHTSAADKTHYKTVENIAYKTSTDQYVAERCRLDVYYNDTARTAPVVVWFHGGGLTGGSKYVPDELKEKGLTVVAVKNVAHYGGDTRRIYVSGHSAGGYITTMLGLDKQWLTRYGVDADSIKALVPFSGQMISHFAYRDMNGIGNLQPLVDRFAPLYHVRPNCPPLVLITGDAETELFGRYEENAYMWRMMKLCGHKATSLYKIDGHNHGDMCHPAFHILLQTIKNK